MATEITLHVVFVPRVVSIPVIFYAIVLPANTLQYTLVLRLHVCLSKLHGLLIDVHVQCRPIPKFPLVLEVELHACSCNVTFYLSDEGMSLCRIESSNYFI